MPTADLILIWNELKGTLADSIAAFGILRTFCSRLITTSACISAALLGQRIVPIVRFTGTPRRGTRLVTQKVGQTIALTLAGRMIFTTCRGKDAAAEENLGQLTAAFPIEIVVKHCLTMASSFPI